MKSCTLPKSSLLRKPAEYRLVYKQGSRIHGDHFSLIFTPNGQAENRLGISIHSQLKGAVRRNRIKRVIREFYRLNRTFLQQEGLRTGTGPAMDIIFTVRKGFCLDSPAAIGQAVGSLFAENGKSEKNSGSKQQIRVV